MPLVRNRNPPLEKTRFFLTQQLHGKSIKTLQNMVNCTCGKKSCRTEKNGTENKINVSYKQKNLLYYHFMIIKDFRSPPSHQLVISRKTICRGTQTATVKGDCKRNLSSSSAVIHFLLTEIIGITSSPLFSPDKKIHIS